MTAQGVLIGFYFWLVPMVVVGLGVAGWGLVTRDASKLIAGGLFTVVGAFAIWLINQ